MKMDRTEKMRSTAAYGFSLIELMITVVIIGLLASIAYPAYTQYTTKSRRTDAYNALTQVANDLEKFYSECSAYPTNMTATTRSCTLPAGTPAGSLGQGATANVSLNQYYALKIEVPPTAGVPPSGYLITATAQGRQASDKTCATITFDNTGAKGAKNNLSIVTTTSCWKN